MKFSDSSSYCVSPPKKAPLAVFWLLVLCGIVCGAIFTGMTDNLDFFHRMLFTHNIFKTRTDISFLSLFFRSFLPMGFLLVLQFFSGHFAFGQVFAYFTAVYRGIASGISASFVYIMLGVKGFFAVLVMIVPFAAATAAVIILGAREAVRQSRQVADFSFFGKNTNEPPDMKLYLVKYAVLVIFAVVLSLADSFLTCFLSGMFFTV